MSFFREFWQIWSKCAGKQEFNAGEHDAQEFQQNKQNFACCVTFTIMNFNLNPQTNRERMNDVGASSFFEIFAKSTHPHTPDTPLTLPFHFIF